MSMHGMRLHHTDHGGGEITNRDITDDVQEKGFENLSNQAPSLDEQTAFEIAGYGRDETLSAGNSAYLGKPVAFVQNEASGHMVVVKNITNSDEFGSFSYHGFELYAYESETGKRVKKGSHRLSYYRLDSITSSGVQSPHNQIRLPLSLAYSDDENKVTFGYKQNQTIDKQYEFDLSSEAL